MEGAMSKTYSRLLRGLLVGCLGLLAVNATAGELGKIRIQFVMLNYVNQPLAYSFLLQNMNPIYSLGPVYWTVRIYNMEKLALIKALSGETEVKQSETVEVVPDQEFIPTEAGDYKIVVEANSEVNISGVQKDSVVVSVISKPGCDTPPTHSPQNVVTMSSGNTITYTAPLGCCYVINPFVNTGVFYTMSPSTPQTISDGQSVTFTITAKEKKPVASLVGFAWKECEKGSPNGKDYIVIAPIPRVSFDSTGPYDPTALQLYCTLFGDPVSTVTGQFVLPDQVDIAFPTNPLLNLVRRYDGGFQSSGFRPSFAPNWQHSFNATIVAQDDIAIVMLPDGRRYGFTKGNAEWIANNKTLVSHLRDDKGTWIFTDVTYQKQYTFDNLGRLTKLDDGSNPVSLTWGNDQLSSATDKAGHSISFTSDPAGRLIEASDGIRTVAYKYSSSGELISVVYPDGRTEHFAYTQRLGELKSITEDNSIVPTVRLEYDNDHRIAKHFDQLGNSWSYSWDDHTATLLDPDGVVEEHVTNNMGQATKIGPQNAQITLAYDESGRPVILRSAESQKSDITYHESGRPTTITVDGETATIEYAKRVWNGAQVYDVASVKYPDGSKCTYQYDSRGLCTSITDEMGSEWRMTYDAYGNVTSYVDAMGRITKHEYNDKGHRTAAELPNGKRIEFISNDYGLPITVTRAGYTAAFNYDLGDRLTTYADELGATTSFHYDSAGNCIAILDPQSNTTQFTYDAESRLKVIQNALGSTASFEYSAAGRFLSLVDPMQSTMQLGYDQHGRLSRVTDRMGNETILTTDKDGVVTTITSPENRSTSFEHDSHGRLTKTSLGNIVEYSIEYDSRANIRSIRDANGRTSAYTYDAVGNLTRLNIGTDLQSSFTYDKSGLIQTATDPEGSVVLWEYDSTGNCISIQDGASRKTSYEYDESGQVKKTVLPGNLGSCTYTYDAIGRLIKIDYAGWSTAYSYDELGRLLQTNSDKAEYNAVGKMISSNGIDMTYNANGWLTSVVYAPDKTVTYEYDKAGRVTSIKDWTGGSETFTYDKDGLLTSINRSNQVSTVYQYDMVGRRTNISDGEKSIEVRFGTGSNIVGVRRMGYSSAGPVQGEVVLSYDKGNACLSHNPDALGRSTMVDSTTIHWNLASQVTELSGMLDGTFVYDGLGRTTKATISGDQVTIVWNDAFGEGVPAILRGAATLYVVTTPDGAVSYVIDSASGEHTFLHFDHQGNVALQTNSSGSQIAAVSYSPYGSILGIEGTPTAPFLFGGQSGVLAIGSDFYVMPGRMYHAGSGRFLSPDPERCIHPQRMNAFVYAYNDPVNWNDWTGRAPSPTPSAADRIVEESNRRLEDAMRKTNEKYDAEIRKIEEQFARRRAQREADERSLREAQEQNERMAAKHKAQEKRDEEEFMRAQRKVSELNEIYLAPPESTPAPEQGPIIGEASGGPSSGNAPVGGAAIGGTGQTPGNGGLRNSGGGPSVQPQPTPAPRGPKPGRTTPQPLGPNGTGRGSYNPGLSQGASEFGAAWNEFWRVIFTPSEWFQW